MGSWKELASPGRKRWEGGWRILRTCSLRVARRASHGPIAETTGGPKAGAWFQGDLPDEEIGWRGWELAKPCRYLQGRWWHPDVEPYCVQALPRLPGLPQGQQRASVCICVYALV